MNLIIWYDGGYLNAKSELHNILAKMGDQKAQMDLLGPGMISVTTNLKPLRIIEQLQEISVNDPEDIKYIIRAMPVDEFCEIGEFNAVLREDIKGLIGSDLYSIEVGVVKGSEGDLKARAQSVIGGRIDENHPQKTLRLTVIENHIAVSLLTPKKEFKR